MQSVFEGNQYSSYEEGNDHDGYAVRIPANTAHKRRVQPHSKLIESQSDTKTVQERNPRPGAIATEHQRKIAGNHENKDAVDVMVDMHSRNRLPMNPWIEFAEEPRAGNTQKEGCCNARWGSF